MSTLVLSFVTQWKPEFFLFFFKPEFLCADLVGPTSGTPPPSVMDCAYLRLTCQPGSLLSLTTSLQRGASLESA